MATEHDPKLVEDLAEVIGGDHWWECDHFNESSEDGCKVDAVRAALDWLAERGRLLPSGGEVRHRIVWEGESGTYVENVDDDQDPQQQLGTYLQLSFVKEAHLERRHVTPWVPVVSDNSEVPSG